MDKAPDAYRTISEVAEDLDLPQHVLRFWETRFAQIKPLKRGGGRRYYRPDDVELLKGIRHLLYKEGYTIKGVQRILKEQGVRAVQAFVRDTLMAESGASKPQVQSVTRPMSVSPTPAPMTHAFVEEPPETFKPESFPSETVVPETVITENWEPSVTRASASSEEKDAGKTTFNELDRAEAQLPESVEQEAFTRPGELAAEPAAARGQISIGQVSMFRGGLQRGEGATTGPMAEFASQIRDRVEHPAFRGETGSLSARDALLMALDELVACRAAIDQILARRQNQ